jgi:formylglycine-generating enzyme required for sulfatase activity
VKVERLVALFAVFLCFGSARPGRPTLDGRRGSDGLDYVRIPAGTFQMGCAGGDTRCDPDELPRHAVALEREVWMSKSEVTVGAYKRFVAALQRPLPAAPFFNPGLAKDDDPVVRISWNDATDYCRWAKGRLPTEAEWERAARGGREGTRYPWGDAAPVCRPGAPNGAMFDDRLGCNKNGPARVGASAANAFGLVDMSGNVWEWCQDRWHESYAGAPSDGDAWESGDGTARVLRGGSWFGRPKELRASHRGWHTANGWSVLIGFRCVRDTPP